MKTTKKKTGRLKADDTTTTVASIAKFLLDDSGSDLPTPFKNELDVSRLDYSPESLRVVDEFINKIRPKIKNLNDQELTKLMLRTGAYCGEVVRRNSKKKYIWATYDEVIQHNGKFEFPDEPQMFYMLTTPDFGEFLFPMAKAVKFMHGGPEDNFEGLWSLSQIK